MSTEAQSTEGTATGERKTDETGSDTDSTATEQQRPSYPEASYLCLRVNEPEKTNTHKDRESVFKKEKDLQVMMYNMVIKYTHTHTCASARFILEAITCDQQV